MIEAMRIGLLMFVAAAPDASSPMQATKKTLDDARAIVEGPRTHDEKIVLLKRLLAEFLDTDSMGKAALGEHEAEFTKDQELEFLRLFRDLFERTYIEKLLLFEKPDFRYTDEKRENGRATVVTKLVTPKDEFTVTYRLRRARNGWKATDIQVEDLSLTDNFRRQIDRLLAKESVNELLARMHKKFGSESDVKDAL